MDALGTTTRKKWFAMAKDKAHFFDRKAPWSQVKDDLLACGLLDSIAGGTYWRSVIRSFQEGEINGYQAERRFSELYQERLRRVYRYVLSMPIREARGQLPKYRMIHATNHPDGCVLMAENIMTRVENLYVHLRGYRQGTLLPMDAEGDATGLSTVQELMTKTIENLDQFTDIREIMARFYCDQGGICEPRVIHQVWRRMETSGAIKVEREPAKTSTGRDSTFFTLKGGKRARIRPAGKTP
jgi:hypothetical protein